MRRLRHSCGLVSLLFLLGVWQNWSCAPMPKQGDGSPTDQTRKDGGSIDSTSPDTERTDRKNADETTRETPLGEGTNDAASPEESTQEKSPPETIVKPAVLTPESFAPIGLEKTEWAMPKSATNETKLHFVLHAGLNTLFGGKTGLYLVEKSKITQIDKKSVVGLVAWKTSTVVVAQSKQLYLWDGKTLAPTNFAKNLDGSEITALAERSSESFWIGTQQSLWLLEKEQLRPFSQIKGVKAMWSAPSKKLLVIVDTQGEYHALEEQAGSWALRSFGKENVTLTALTSFEDAKKLDFWGLGRDNQLLLRKSLSGNEAAWWPFRLKPDKDDKETLKITQLLFQRKPEHTWALTTGDLYRLSEGVARTLPRPTKLQAIKAANSTSDGALWLSDGAILVRFGKALPATEYKSDVAPIMTANCIRCHKPGGKARFRPLQTYKQVRDIASEILKRIDITKNMPPGQTLPASQIALFKSWIAGGYQP